MTHEELWQEYVQANPEFLTTGCNFTAKGLRKFFDKVATIQYREGYRTGLAEGAAIKRVQDQGKSDTKAMPDFLQDLLNGKGPRK